MEKRKSGEENSLTNKLFKKTTVGIIASCIMMILGVILFFLPSKATTALVWLAIFGFLVHGIYHIIIFIKARSFWPLSFFILNIIIVILLFFQAFQLFGKTSLYNIIIPLLCFYCFLDAGMQFLSAFMLKKEKKEAGWTITTAIINTILALLILAKVLFLLYSVAWTFAIYFAIFGILLLVQCIPQPELEKTSGSR